MFSSLTVIEPPADEPVSVDLARRHCRIDTVDDDDLLGIYIASARSWAEVYLGRVLLQQQLQWVVARELPNRSMPYVGLPMSLMVFPLWFPWEALHRNALELPRQPVVSVDSVAAGSWGQPDTTLVADTDYVVDTLTARVQMRQTWPAQCRDHLVITFTAGASSATAIDAPIVNAILLLTGFLYENRGDVSAEMPAGARALLSPYRLVSFG